MKRKLVCMAIATMLMLSVPVLAEDYHVGPVVSGNGYQIGAYAGGAANPTRTTVIDSTGLVSGTNGVKIATTSAAPTCNASLRGLLWLSPGGAGAKDNVVICAKDNTDTYGWRTIY